MSRLGTGLRAAALLGAAVGPVAMGQVWQAQGPSPTNGGQTEGITNNPVAGSVNALAAHPTNAAILYAAATNGGIWRTTNATASSPTWTPLTDAMPSLATGALAFDPTDASFQTLVAGTGQFSSFGTGGNAVGMYRTTDGGANWTQLGASTLNARTISAVAGRGTTLLAATTTNGLYRSTNTGGTFTQVSGVAGTGLPAGAIRDMVGDPSNPDVFYAAVTGTSFGLFRSADRGATWASVTGATSGTFNSSAANVKLAVHASAGNNVVYAGIVGSARTLVGLYRSTNGGGSWTALDLPTTNENGTITGLQPEAEQESTEPEFEPALADDPGGQGNIHFSMAADPVNPNIVYLGGDRQPLSQGPDTGSFPNSIGARNYSGRLFRVDASQGTGSQSTPLTHAFTSNNSSPHADSRRITFDATGNIIEADDGGVYRRSSPSANTGSWTSVNGTLQVSEMHSLDYDRVSHVIIGGTQDTGVTEQTTRNGITWRQVSQGDGGKVAVDDSSPTQSIRYSSAQFLGGFARRTVNTSNGVTSTVFPALTVVGTSTKMTDVDAAQFYSPIELNKVSSPRLVIGTNTHVFESANRGDTVTDLGALTGTPSAMAYGGKSGGSDNPDVLYVGTSSRVYTRTVAGAALARATAFPGSGVRDLVMDADEWHSLFVASPTAVYQSLDAGGAWSNITGNLSDSSIRAIEFMARPDGNDVLIVGGLTGVYFKFLSLGTAWGQLGTGLPEAPVYDLRYDPYDDVLVVGTIGRGAWTIANASVLVPEPVLAGVWGLAVVFVGRRRRVA